MPSTIVDGLFTASKFRGNRSLSPNNDETFRHVPREKINFFRIRLRRSFWRVKIHGKYDYPAILTKSDRFFVVMQGKRKTRIYNCRTNIGGSTSKFAGKGLSLKNDVKRAFLRRNSRQITFSFKNDELSLENDVTESYNYLKNEGCILYSKLPDKEGRCTHERFRSNP